MDDNSSRQSLKSGSYSTKTCWDDNSRFFLRVTLHAGVSFLLITLLIQIVLCSVFYHRISDLSPILISPYESSSDDHSLFPCVYPRHPNPLPSDTKCQAESYCPPNFSCSVVADQKTKENTFVCLSNKRACGDLHYCTNYITGLTSTTSANAKTSDVAIAHSLYLLGVVPLGLAIVLTITMWIVFNLWTVVVGDPFESKPVSNDPGAIASAYRIYSKLAPSNMSGPLQCLLNFGLIIPLISLLLVGGVAFLSGVSPSLQILTEIVDANCFSDPWLYLFSSSMIGWITALLVTQLFTALSLWALLCLYTIKPLFASIWDARVYLTVVLLIFIIVTLGVILELSDLVISG